MLSCKLLYLFIYPISIILNKTGGDMIQISKGILKEVRKSWRKHILGKNPVGRPRKRRKRVKNSLFK